jgi:hypothetical protein
MKVTCILLVIGGIAQAALGDIVITPIRSDQVVEKASGDCFFGVVTPQGCG